MPFPRGGKYAAVYLFDSHFGRIDLVKAGQQLTPSNQAVFNFCTGKTVNFLHVFNNTTLNPNTTTYKQQEILLNGIPVWQSCTFPDTFNYQFTATGVYNFKTELYEECDTLKYNPVFTVLTFVIVDSTTYRENMQVGQCAGDATCVNFNLGTDSAFGYQIDWGDGNISASSSLVIGGSHSFCHTYSSAGSYRITSSWNNRCGNIEDTIIEIHPPQPNFQYTYACNNQVNFNNLTTCKQNVASWIWDFGDGTQHNIQHPVHIYQNPGSYVVSLTAIDNNGNHYTTYQSVSVNSPKPTITGPSSICEEDQADYQAADGFIGYNWSGTSGISLHSSNGSQATFDFTLLDHCGYIVVEAQYAIGTNGELCTVKDSLLVCVCCKPENNDDGIITHDPFSSEMLMSYGSPLGVVRNKAFYINGTFTIDQPIIFEDCQFYFNQGSKVEFASATSTVVSADFHECLLSACKDYMWEGIFLDQPNEWLRMFSSTIRFALTGVSATGNSNIIIETTEFNSCAVGVNINNLVSSQSTIYGSTFLHGNLLKPLNSSSPQVGIKTFNYSLAKNLILSINQNEFKNLDVGVQMINSSLDLTKNQFESYRANCTGVEAFRVGLGRLLVQPTLYASLNSFEDLHFGIHMKNTNSVIHRNTFNNTPYGITLLESRNHKITNNTLSYDASLIRNRGIGIQLQNVFNAGAVINDVLISGNIISHYKTGIVTRRINGSSVYITKNQINTTVHSSAHETRRGIVVIDGSFSTVSNNQVQASPYIGLGKNHAGLALKDADFLYVSSNTITNYKHGMFINGGNTGAEFLCNNLNGCGNGFYFNNNGTDLTNQGTATHSSGNWWQGNRNYYRLAGKTNNLIAAQWFWKTEISGNGERPNPSNRDVFLNPRLSDSSSIYCPSFRTETITLAALNFLDSTLEYVINGDRPFLEEEASINQHLDQQVFLRILDSTKPVIVLPHFYTTYNHYVDSMQQSTFSTQAQMADIFTTSRTTSFAPSSVDAETGFLNRMFLSYFNHHRPFSSQDSAKLQMLAAGNPIYNRSNVYAARVLLNYWQEDSLSHPTPRTTFNSEENVGHDEIIVFPNPSNGLITIKCSVDLYGKPLLIYTSKGDCIQVMPLQETIDVRNLPKGIYFYNLVTDVKSYAGKILLID